jgi:hypothetical protein
MKGNFLKDHCIDELSAARKVAGVAARPRVGIRPERWDSSRSAGAVEYFLMGRL